MEKRSLTNKEFEALVREAVKSLPREFRSKLENVTVVIEAEPSAGQQKEAGTGTDEELLGLYEGVPLSERTHQEGSLFPDKITIFRGPVLRSCRSRHQIREAVRETVLHEFAHYFGISDEHMIEDGTY